MPRSIVGHTSNDFNEISVSSQSAEQFRLSASVEQDRSSFDDLTEIQRPPRSGGNSPTSIDIGEGQQYRDRSQSSETSSRGRSRHRKRSKRESHHRSRDRNSRHHSSERIHLGQMVIALRIDMTLKMRADAVIVLMTEVSAPVVPIGHPTEMLEILRTDLAEIRFLMTGNRFSWITITLLFRR